MIMGFTRPHPILAPHVEGGGGATGQPSRAARLRGVGERAKRPTVSVVIPTHNRKETLRRCLQGVLAQTYPAAEVIVVDDGSTDGTEALVRTAFPTVRYTRLPTPRGPARARNRGIALARGDIVAFTDDDCVPPPEWLAHLVEGFHAYPEAAAVGGLQKPPDDVLRTHLLARYEWFLTRQVYGLGEGPVVGRPAPGGTNNLAVRRSVLLEIGGFDERFPVAAGEDADLLRRIAARGYPTVILPISVTHLQTYRWPDFLRQQVRRGIGAAYYHAKWGELSPLGREILRLLASPLTWVHYTGRYRAPVMAAVHTVATACQTWGRIRGRRQLQRRGGE